MSRHATHEVIRFANVQVLKAPMRSAHRCRSLRLTLLSPQTLHFAAIVNVSKAGGVPFGLLDFFNEDVFSESCDILDSGSSGSFSDLLQRHVNHFSYLFEFADQTARPL